jgi:hypothetical protein
MCSHSTQTVTLDVEMKELAFNANVVEDNGPTHNTIVTLKHLRGRCNVAVLTRERILVAKLDGWPEVAIF